MFAEVVTIEAVERLRNSRNGNPRFAITYKLAGQSSTLNTAADAAFSYEIGNPGLRCPAMSSPSASMAAEPSEAWFPHHDRRPRTLGG